MDNDREMAVLVNDLDSMIHRIESLPAHPDLTDALIAITQAKASVTTARAALHQREMRERLDARS